MPLKVLPRRLTAAPNKLKLPPKQTASHYQTPEHRDWSAAVIARAKGKCQGCGERKRLIADHIREIRDGGDPLDLNNGQALCWSCHTAKTARERKVRHRSA